jgi:hypothetical protein
MTFGRKRFDIGGGRDVMNRMQKEVIGDKNQVGTRDRPGRLIPEEKRIRRLDNQS